MLKIAVLADTHIPKRAKTLPAAAWEIVRAADAIIHAGDILTAAFLEELKTYAPVYAVRGNNDDELEMLPERMTFQLEQISVALIHDSGSKKGREDRMRKLFPKADCVIFGHSHIPCNEDSEGQLLFNPGSPTDRRMQPYCTMGVLRLDGRTIDAEIVKVS